VRLLQTGIGINGTSLGAPTRFEVVNCVCAANDFARIFIDLSRMAAPLAIGHQGSNNGIAARSPCTHCLTRLYLIHARPARIICLAWLATIRHKALVHVNLDAIIT
jgi:hypothetical protein